MVFVLILGAIFIILLFSIVTFLIIKLWLKLIDSLEKNQHKDEKSIKKDGYRFLYSLLEKDYDIDRYDIIARVSVVAILICIGVLCIWFSVGFTYFS